MKKIITIFLTIVLLSGIYIFNSYGATSSDYTYKVLNDNTVEITKYTGSETVLTIPDTLDNKTVTSIGETAFELKTKITSVTIPDTITKIGKGAFTQCKALSTIKIGNNVQTIDTYAFDRTAITNITIPASVTTMGKYVFYDCLQLEKIEVNGNNTAFSSQDGVLYNKQKTELISYPVAKRDTTYTIPGTVTTLDEICFRKSTYLEQINIPDSVTTLDNFVFSYLPALKTITLPRSITSIGIGTTFQNCTALTTATINCNTTTPAQFQNCTQLNKIDYSR